MGAKSCGLGAGVMQNNQGSRDRESPAATAMELSQRNCRNGTVEPQMLCAVCDSFCSVGMGQCVEERGVYKRGKTGGGEPALHVGCLAQLHGITACMRRQTMVPWQKRDSARLMLSHNGSRASCQPRTIMTACMICQRAYISHLSAHIWKQIDALREILCCLS